MVHIDLENQSLVRAGLKIQYPHCTGTKKSEQRPANTLCKCRTSLRAYHKELFIDDASKALNVQTVKKKILNSSSIFLSRNGFRDKTRVRTKRLYRTPPLAVDSVKKQISTVQAFMNLIKLFWKVVSTKKIGQTRMVMFYSQTISISRYSYSWLSF